MPEKDVNSLPGIRWWGKRRSSYYFRNGIIFLMIACMMAFLFWTVKDDIKGIRESVPFVCLLLFLVFFSGYQLVLWGRSFRLNVTNYWFGTIVDMYCIRNRKRKIRSYRIVADVNGKTMEGVCLLRTYNLAKIGDQVLLFTLEGDRVFCVHPGE